VVTAVQVWNPDDWETLALGLLQSRHGALNVHKIPAAHKGDFGIDYYCAADAVAYQCYAVQEPVDISTRAERQKRKITTDTGKIISNAIEIGQLFLGTPIKRWMLLVPVHDSKDVNLHCAKKTLEIRGQRCSHLDDHFEVGVHDQKSFAAEVVASGMSALATVTFDIPDPTPEEMSQWQVGSPNLLANATHKLKKRTGQQAVQEAVAEAAKCFLQGKSILDALRSGSPDLHEKVIGVVASRSRRLAFTGPQGGPTANSVLNTEVENLIAAIKAAASNLSNDHVEQIALGTVSEWIMRCPLDFTADAT
jgi:hypothetical protein